MMSTKKNQNNPSIKCKHKCSETYNKAESESFKLQSKQWEKWIENTPNNGEELTIVGSLQN